MVIHLQFLNLPQHFISCLFKQLFHIYVLPDETTGKSSEKIHKMLTFSWCKMQQDLSISAEKLRITSRNIHCDMILTINWKTKTVTGHLPAVLHSHPQV